MERMSSTSCSVKPRCPASFTISVASVWLRMICVAALARMAGPIFEATISWTYWVMMHMAPLFFLTVRYMDSTNSLIESASMLQASSM